MSSKYKSGAKTLNCHSKHERRAKGSKQESDNRTQTHTVRISLPEERRQSDENMSERKDNVTATKEDKQTIGNGGTDKTTDHQTDNTQTGGLQIPREKATVSNLSSNNASQATDKKYTLSQKKTDNTNSDDLRSTDVEEKDNDNSSPAVREQRSRNGVEDETSLQMFLSTDNMEREEEYQRSRGTRGGRKVVFHRQYSDETKRKHEEIIRRILDEFSLEETKNKYRNSNACEHRRNGKRYFL